MPFYYLLPIETVLRPGTTIPVRGPKYFLWHIPPAWGIVHPGIDCRYEIMDYGFVPACLLAAHDISPTDHAALILNADVYLFPDNLSAPVTQNIQPFFEAINIPTDWLTPSTTYLELLRMVSGMFQFNQRYGGISGGHSIFESSTLSTRLRQMTAQEQAWFDATVASFGFDPSQINRNSQLRLLLRQAGDYWQGIPFKFAGTEF